MPVELLGLQRRGYKLLNSYAEMHAGTNGKMENLNQPEKLGVFVLYEGTFVVMTKAGLRLTELSGDYFG